MATCSPAACFKALIAFLLCKLQSIVCSHARICVRKSIAFLLCKITDVRKSIIFLLFQITDVRNSIAFLSYKLQSTGCSMRGYMLNHRYKKIHISCDWIQIILTFTDKDVIPSFLLCVAQKLVIFPNYFNQASLHTCNEIDHSQEGASYQIVSFNEESGWDNLLITKAINKLNLYLQWDLELVFHGS